MGLLSGGFDGGFNSTDQTINKTTNKTDVTNTSAKSGSIAVARGGHVEITDGGAIQGAILNAHDSVAAIADLAGKAFEVSNKAVYDSLALAGNRSFSLDSGTSDLLKGSVKNILIAAAVIAALFVLPKAIGAFK